MILFELLNCHISEKGKKYKKVPLKTRENNPRKIKKEKIKEESNMNELFVKYRRKLTTEGVLRALLIGALVGLAVMLVLAGVLWYMGNKQLVWLPPVVFAGVTGLLFVILYFAKFKPSETSIARRLDALGLEERMITMTEFQNDDSYIARRQREDAIQSLQQIEASQLKMKLKRGFVVALSIVGVISVGMWALQILMKVGIVKPGNQLIPELLVPPKEYVVEYATSGDGLVEGDMTQVLLTGESPEAVEAVAMDGWVFVGWDDGMNSPYRKDSNIIDVMDRSGVDSIVLTAVFQELQENADDGGEGEAAGQPGGEQGQGQPGGEGEGEGEGEGDGEQEGDPSDMEGEGAGGKYTPSNQVIDGKTYYGDDYDASREDAANEVTGNTDMGEDQSGAVEKYFENIQP